MVGEYIAIENTERLSQLSVYHFQKSVIPERFKKYLTVGMQELKPTKYAIFYI